MTSEIVSGHLAASQGHSGEAGRMLQITLSLPDPLLTLNKRLHWAARARHTREQRYWAKAGAMLDLAEQGARGWPVFAGRVRVDVEVRPRPGMKRHDDTAIWEAMKPTMDGLQDAGVVADDKQFVVGALSWSEERTAQLVLTLTEVG